MTSDMSDKRDSTDSKTDAAASRVTSRQKAIQVGKGFYLSRMNSEEGETQLLSTACTIYPLIFDQRYAQAMKAASV